jgi:hypothetical protein
MAPRPIQWERALSSLESGLTQAPDTGGPNRHTTWLATSNPERPEPMWDRHSPTGTSSNIRSKRGHESAERHHGIIHVVREPDAW